ncbi:MAG: hypothetical protein PHC52_00465 [Syntrophales bacterium]|nr:hypothetical protein [Syntrophales bacterium]
MTWCGLDLGDDGEESTHPCTCGECVDARDFADAEARAKHEEENQPPAPAE